MGKWTRRAFITTGVLAGGALAVGVAIRPGHRAPKVAGEVTEDGEVLVSMWVKIDPSNKITLIAPHSEMGQGAQNALTQMLADEIDARWEDTAFMEAPAIDEYANWALGKGYLIGDADIPEVLVPTIDGAMLQVAKAMKMQITGGSLSIRTTGVYGVRAAGAAARELLINAASEAWGVPASQLDARDTHIVDTTTGKRAPFAEFALAASQTAPSASPTLKTPDQFRIMGKSAPRRDIPAKVDGTAVFGIDAQVPGMKHAAIMAAPVFGAQLVFVDARKAESMAGVSQVVSLEDAVAVVADGYWQASEALKTLKVQWSQTDYDDASSESLFQQFDQDLARGIEGGSSKADVDDGDVEGALASAAATLDSTYRVPYLAHACMEPMNATARVTDDSCEVWIGTQNPLGFRYEVADALDMDVEQVQIHQHPMGGGFGRRSNSDTAVQAARIARAAGEPVKLIWSREEDVRHDHYRPAVASRFRAALDDGGNISAWENVYHEKHEPVEAPTIPYTVGAQKIHHVESPTHVPFGPWRSVDHSQHGFFTEAFFDEVAVAAGKDPYEYRMALLRDRPRHQKVLQTAAEQAGWGETLPKGRGRGISLQESFGSLVAQVVDVTVSDGAISVDRVVVAVDAGFAVSPDGLTAQMESGVNYGLTAALYGEITIEDGAVKQSNFHDYPMVRMGDSPLIETYIINSGEAWGGAGEPGTPGIAPALVNAVFDATGLRVRELPLSKQDFSDFS
ncbi:xanthine dehydrogenase family protein molybdopterin-binding subunit [Congregibacter litoralis]|uniref:Aerobic-type carbon monoxide dehydrogenase, large subunit CoxL/CutL-like protein n=1 Tax=Congregibacter litoralis KT71 TaxID=314285 RepID=A4A7F1_9GAMM|nr:molybdopterin cofactor-binding domain-containing protein [Congregibacter litoralis]EAQ98220.1 Aerobic-type carbon monoxide dehydrogenase, large subunit CoxL/CutL-like protein [Congregibacter litoralis KT71]